MIKANLKDVRKSPTCSNTQSLAVIVKRHSINIEQTNVTIKECNRKDYQLDIT